MLLLAFLNNVLVFSLSDILAIANAVCPSMSTALILAPWMINKRATFELSIRELNTKLSGSAFNSSQEKKIGHKLCSFYAKTPP